MPLRFRRMSRLRLKLFLAFCALASLLEIFYLHQTFLSSLDSSLSPQFGRQQIFLASTHWNNEAIIRGHWNAAVLELVQEIGVENIYISIYESGGWDDTKGALRELDFELGRLGVSKTIILDETTHIDEIGKPPTASGWIDTPRGKKELRRIPYLSKLRNLSLKPLHNLEKSGIKFAYVLFLNDVVFKVGQADFPHYLADIDAIQIDDYRKLLNTNGGSYAAACALDFAKPPHYYDTFALRDSDGEEPVMQTWPYFRSRASRQAVIENRPVPLSSCWNGMVMMDATPFYDLDSPLEFRGISDGLAERHVEGSECCLVHADNPLTASKGVWLNPDVRVGYSEPAYEAVHRDFSWLTMSEFSWGIWKNRLLRYTTTTWFKKRIVLDRLHAWERETPKHQEPGAHCLINEMQVLVSNGWAHV